MPISTEDLLGYLGDQFKDVADIDDFKGRFGKTYFTEKQIHSDKDLLSRFTGRTFGHLTKKIKDYAKELELELEEGTFTDQEPEKAIRAIGAKLSERAESQINELKGQIGKGGEEAIKPWQEKVAKYEASLNDERKAKKELAAALEAEKLNAANTVKTFKVGYAKKDVMTSLGYDATVMKDDLKRKGWESHVNENFRFDFDEHDQFIITDKEGNKIKNPKKADEWLAPKDVLAMEADKLGLLPKNPQGGKPAGSAGWTPPPAGAPTAPGSLGQAFRPAASTPANGEPVKGRRVMPGMEQFTQR